MPTTEKYSLAGRAGRLVLEHGPYFVALAIIGIAFGATAYELERVDIVGVSLFALLAFPTLGWAYSRARSELWSIATVGYGTFIYLSTFTLLHGMCLFGCGDRADPLIAGAILTIVFAFVLTATVAAHALRRPGVILGLFALHIPFLLLCMVSEYGEYVLVITALSIATIRAHIRTVGRLDGWAYALIVGFALTLLPVGAYLIG